MVLRWTGRILSGLAVLFLLFDGISKFILHMMPPEALEASTKLGWSLELMPTLGTILLFCTILYALPRTSVLGAILLTGYLGGAVAAHLRVGNPLMSHTLFPVYVAAILWSGLYLREPRLRLLFPFVK